MKTKHIALAIGTGGQIPMTPNIPGRVCIASAIPAINKIAKIVWFSQEKFKGTVFHSADYRNSDPWTGKAGVVIGAANTGERLVHYIPFEQGHVTYSH